MLVCYKCGKEMSCTQNGVGVRYGESHVYPGDLYSCKCCGIEIIKTVSTAVHDPGKNINTIKGIEQTEHCSACLSKHYNTTGFGPWEEPDNLPYIWPI